MKSVSTSDRKLPKRIMKRVVAYLVIIGCLLFICAAHASAEEFFDKGGASVPTKAIPFSKAQNARMASPSETAAVTYRSYDILEYEMNNPYIVEDRFVAFGQYDRDDRCSIGLFDLRTEKYTKYALLNKNWWVEDVVADDKAVYWVEYDTEPYYGWTLVRQPRNGGSPKRIRHFPQGKDVLNVPKPSCDGRYIVWMECKAAKGKAHQNMIVAYDLQTDKMFKVTTFRNAWNTHLKVKVVNGKVCFTDKASSDKWLIRCFDVKTRREEMRFSYGSRMIQQVAFDGERLTFLELSDIHFAGGNQYVYDVKKNELTLLVGQQKAWRNEMGGGKVLALVPLEYGPTCVYLSDQKKLLRLPLMNCDGYNMEGLGGTIDGNSIATVGIIRVPYDYPYPPDLSPIYLRDRLVVLTLPK